MKFSKMKKAKIRKRNQRRINRCCRDMIGCHIFDFERDYHDYHGYEVKDQAKINGTMYLLTQIEDEQYAIYKIVKVGEYVRLSAKRVLESKEAFSNHANWKLHSRIQITTEGEIKFVRGNYGGLIFLNVYIIEE